MKIQNNQEASEETNKGGNKREKCLILCQAQSEFCFLCEERYQTGASSSAVKCKRNAEQSIKFECSLLQGRRPDVEDGIRNGNAQGSVDCNEKQ